MYDAPLLAAWRYGLGRTAAFTSDFGGRWSRQWLEWSQFPRFAGQLVRWTERPSDSRLLHPTMTVARGRASVKVDAYDSLGAFVNGLEMNGILIRPGGVRSEMAIPQTEPGLYEISFPAEEVGDYTLTVTARRADAELAPLTVGTSVAYPDEYLLSGTNMALLQKLASETGGRVITGPDDAAGREAALRREPGRTGAGSDAWRAFLLAAAALFLADIAVRRLAALRELLGRASGWLRSLRGKPVLSSEELAGLVASARKEERARMKGRLSGIPREGKLDSELAPYLYIARLRSSRASREESKKS